MKLTLFQRKFEVNYLAAPSGARDANYFEPLLNCIIIEFNKLMKVYETLGENKEVDIY